MLLLQPCNATILKFVNEFYEFSAAFATIAATVSNLLSIFL